MRISMQGTAVFGSAFVHPSRYFRPAGSTGAPGKRGAPLRGELFMNREARRSRSLGAVCAAMLAVFCTALRPAPALAQSRIAFVSERDGGWGQIYVMNANGKGPTRLTFDNAPNLHPHFSPSGDKIVFSSRRDGNFEIYVMHADGTGQTRITNNPTAD